MAKYTRTRQRMFENRQADSSVVPPRPTLLAAHPSSNQSRLLYHSQTIVVNLISFSSKSRTANPFLLHVLPMTSCSMQVQRAVEAVAAAHLHLLGVEPAIVPARLHTQSLNLLAAEFAIYIGSAFPRKQFGRMSTSYILWSMYSLQVN
jgi:hypothetical protein